MAELIDSYMHEPDDHDLNDDQLFTEAAQADKPLDFTRDIEAERSALVELVRWQAARRLH